MRIGGVVSGFSVCFSLRVGHFGTARTRRRKAHFRKVGEKKNQEWRGEGGKAAGGVEQDFRSQSLPESRVLLDGQEVKRKGASKLSVLLTDELRVL